MEKEPKNKKVKSEKKEAFKKHVKFTAKMEATVHVTKEGAYNFQWGIKNIAGDGLRETFILLLLDSICDEYGSAANRIMEEGTHEQKIMIKRDEAMYKSLRLAQVNTRERMINFLMAATNQAIEKEIRGNGIEIIGATKEEILKLGK